MSLKTTFLFITLLFLQVVAKAMQSDSATVTVPTSIRFIYDMDFRDGNPNFQKPDSSLYRVDRKNEAINKNYNYLGVPGSAAQSPWFTNLCELITRTTVRSYDLYTIPVDSVRYYSVNKKFTYIEYHSGTFKELAIDVLHTQNITKGWNMGLSFRRFSVKDYMIFSDTYKGDLVLFTSLHSNNNKYNLFAHALWGSIENQMNGGLSNDSTFIYGNVDNTAIRGLGWKISDAKQNQRSKRFHLSQYYDFGGSKEDSAGNITSVPSIRINHKITFERTSISYIDATPDSSFYTNFFYSGSTYDSLHSDLLSNEFAIIIPADQKRSSAFFRNWSMSVAAEYLTTKYEQKEKYSWDNLLLSGKIISKYDSSDFSSIADVKYVSKGRDKGNYQGDIDVQTKQYKFGSFGGKVRISQQSPDFYLLHYNSNNFIWQNTFSKTKNNSIQLYYSFSKYKFSISASRQQIENSLFINEVARPAQLENKLTVDQLIIEKNFQFRIFNFYNLIGIQTNDNKNNIHLSPLFSQHSLFIEKKLFGKKLLTDIGFNMAYNSAYYSDAFMPSTALFYLQNEIKTGGYFRVDLFARAKIKSASIFLKMENVGDNIGKKSYFLVPHYAQPGNVFRFGVSWRFFDQ